MSRTESNTVGTGTVSPVSDADKVAENARKQSERHATSVATLKSLRDGRYGLKTPATERAITASVHRFLGYKVKEILTTLRKSLPKGKEAVAIGEGRMADHVRANAAQSLRDARSWVLANRDEIIDTMVNDMERMITAATPNTIAGTEVTGINLVSELLGVPLTNTSDQKKLNANAWKRLGVNPADEIAEEADAA